jgi:hypothetical protein
MGGGGVTGGKVFVRTFFELTSQSGGLRGVGMNASLKRRWCWRKDLAAFRGLPDRDRAGLLVVLEWLEN